jgi:hypothetical protein
LVDVPCSIPTCGRPGTRWAHVTFEVNGPVVLRNVIPTPWGPPRGTSSFTLTVPKYVCDWHARAYEELGILIVPPLPPKGSTGDAEQLPP